MDENKIMEAMKGIYDSLSDEQKERADKVDSYEAFMKFLDEENIELPEELMEDAAGGKWFWQKDQGDPTIKAVFGPVVDFFSKW